MTAIPEGYIEHDGGECPVAPDQFVNCIIRTSEGLGHSQITRARLHEWASSKHPGGIGAVVAYKTFDGPVHHEQAGINLHHRWPEAPDAG
jgi:hypothetical protein